MSCSSTWITSLADSKSSIVPRAPIFCPEAGDIVQSGWASNQTSSALMVPMLPHR